MPQTITKSLNDLDEGALQTALMKCCAAKFWVEAMIAKRPFSSDQALVNFASAAWWKLDRADWLEAFSAHPKIGDVDSLRAKFGNTRGWASGEQAGVAVASEATLQRLAELNRRYEERFGYIFIVCATGKTADEMLAILESRLTNDPESELKVAASEQLKITLLRLQKLAD
ncbi:MAG TPA: 2-oxo-4-hydroxy-4-carboxy-5-ureidoimidazoline decarboxylase [Pirellulales bacterium]|jgi:OHCU decarboxylase